VIAGKTRDEITAWMVERLASAARVPPDAIDLAADLATLGVDSLTAVLLTAELETYLARPVSPTLLVDGDCIDDVVSALCRPARSGDAAPSRERLMASVVTDERQLLDAFALRYQNYVEHGHIPRNAERLFYDRYDALPNTATFGVHAGDTLVGSIRGCVYMPSRGWCSLPAKDAYATAFAKVSEARDVLIEWNRFVVDETLARSSEVHAALWSCVAWFGDRMPRALHLAAVRGPHEKYYERFGFSRVSAPSLYPGTTFEASLMVMDSAAGDGLSDTVLGAANIAFVEPRVSAAPEDARIFDLRFPREDR
jgi:hypothetical protein